MLILISLVAVFIIGCLLIKIDFDGGVILTLLSGCFLVVALAGFPVEHIQTKAEIVEYEATRQTLESARKNGNDWELAAIQTRVIESNRWLLKKQYYNSTIFDIWIPDAIDKVEIIK